MEYFSRTLLTVSYPSLFVDKFPSCRRSSRGHRTIDSTFFFAAIYRDGPFNVIIFVITRQQFFFFPLPSRRKLHDENNYTTW